MSSRGKKKKAKQAILIANQSILRALETLKVEALAKGQQEKK